jgi:hypothetical protein
MKAFKLRNTLSLTKEEELNKKKKIYEKRFDSMVRSNFSKKLNEDMSEYIKEQLMKVIHNHSHTTYSDINKSLLRLIKIIYKQINDSIHFDDEIKIRYSNKNFIPERDIKIIYDMIILILKYFPNKEYRLTKYKFSKVRKYFIYKVDSEKYDNVKYLIFDYSNYDTESLFWIYNADNEDNLKYLIKENFKMTNAETGKNHKVSLNRSERSSKFNSNSSNSR